MLECASILAVRALKIKSFLREAGRIVEAERDYGGERDRGNTLGEGYDEENKASLSVVLVTIWVGAEHYTAGKNSSRLGLKQLVAG